MSQTFPDISTWISRTGHDRMRSFTADDGHFWIEQNPTKRTKWAKLARDDHAIAWEIAKEGGYSGRMLIDGEILTPAQATKKVLPKSTAQRRAGCAKA